MHRHPSTRRFVSSAGLLLALTSVSGCYSEGLEIYDLTGTVRIPADAATYQFTRPVLDDAGNPVTDDSGNPVTESETRTDVKLLGPVYIGLYADVRNDIFAYPYPEAGPPVAGANVGDTYPYGGTTMGDYRYACYEFFQCRMVSGRYVDFDEIVSWWKDVVGNPITDRTGAPVLTGAAMEDTCYTLRRFTEPLELGITAAIDRNDDGLLDANDLDFTLVEDPDGDYFEGEFTIPQAEFFPGMKAWAMLERPSAGSFLYDDTCNDELGYQEFTFDQNWRAGASNQDVLNRPAGYLNTGDRVASVGFEWNDPWEPAEIVLDFEVQ